MFTSFSFFHSIKGVAEKKVCLLLLMRAFVHSGPLQSEVVRQLFFLRLWLFLFTFSLATFSPLFSSLFLSVCFSLSLYFLLLYPSLYHSLSLTSSVYISLFYLCVCVFLTIIRTLVEFSSVCFV